jgi:hypothetical protein
MMNTLHLKHEPSYHVMAGIERIFTDRRFWGALGVIAFLAFITIAAYMLSANSGPTLTRFPVSPYMPPLIP